MAYRIILAIDNGIFLEGLVALFKTEPEFVVVGEARDGTSAWELAKDSDAEVLVVGLFNPLIEGTLAGRDGKENGPRVKIIALSNEGSPLVVSEAIKAGFTGFLAKDSSFQELKFAISAVARGKTYINAPLVDPTPAKSKGLSASGQQPEPILSPREREVTVLVANGLAMKEVAHALDVSLKTVETQRRQVMKKLQLRSVAELTKYAIKAGLVGLD